MTTKKEEKVEKVSTVKMYRESDEGPTTADVHPDEVAEFEVAGWSKAKPKASDDDE